MFPDPVIEAIGDILVLRDDLIPGGTKRRILPHVLSTGTEYVYASPAYGYAQVALAYACRDIGSTTTVFVAKRKTLHPRTLEAKGAGAKIVQVPYGYLSNVRSKATEYAKATGAILLQWGLDFPAFNDAMTSFAMSLPISPNEVWSVSGSGTLQRALQRAWPAAKFSAVQIGARSDVGRATLYVAPEPFDRDAKRRPPFPSCGNYDAKAWQFIIGNAKPGALFWNVAG